MDAEIPVILIFKIIINKNRLDSYMAISICRSLHDLFLYIQIEIFFIEKAFMEIELVGQRDSDFHFHEFCQFVHIGECHD